MLHLEARALAFLAWLASGIGYFLCSGNPNSLFGSVFFLAVVSFAMLTLLRRWVCTPSSFRRWRASHFELPRKTAKTRWACGAFRYLFYSGALAVHYRIDITEGSARPDEVSLQVAQPTYLPTCELIVYLTCEEWLLHPWRRNCCVCIVSGDSPGGADRYGGSSQGAGPPGTWGVTRLGTSHFHVQGKLYDPETQRCRTISLPRWILGAGPDTLIRHAGDSLDNRRAQLTVLRRKEARVRRAAEDMASLPPLRIRNGWEHRLPELLGTLRELERDLIGRADVELLFGVSRVSAIRILNRFGARRAGNVLALSRTELVARLEALERDPQMAWERERHQNVLALARGEEILTRAAQYVRKQEPYISGDAAVRHQATRFAQLPDGVELDNGRMSVSFSGYQDFLTKLGAVLYALRNDDGRMERYLNHDSVSAADR